jgi:hypothetical protein
VFYICSVSDKLSMTQCLSTGRPPAICDPLLVDCDFPFEEATEHDEGGPKLGADAIAFQHARDMIARVIVLTSMIEPPQYQEILALDSTIRAAWVSKRCINSLIGPGYSALARAAILAPHRAASKCFTLSQPKLILTRPRSPHESPSWPLCASCRGVSFGPNRKPVWHVVPDGNTLCMGDPGLDARLLPGRSKQGCIRAPALLDVGDDCRGPEPFSAQWLRDSHTPHCRWYYILSSRKLHTRTACIPSWRSWRTCKVSS